METMQSGATASEAMRCDASAFVVWSVNQSGQRFRIDWNVAGCAAE
jgi:hypothetical protein